MSNPQAGTSGAHELVVYPHKSLVRVTRWLRQLGPFLALLAGIWAWIFWDFAEGEPVAKFGLLAMPVLILASWVGTLKYERTFYEPALTVSRDGFGFRMGGGRQLIFLPWGEIKTMSVMRAAGQKYLAITPKDPRRLDLRFGPLTGTMVRLRQWRGTPPMVAPLSGISIAPNYLLAAIEQHRRLDTPLRRYDRAAIVITLVGAVLLSFSLFLQPGALRTFLRMAGFTLVLMPFTVLVVWLLELILHRD